MTIEIGMPVYRPSKRLGAILTALSCQTYKDFFISIYNDTRPEEKEELQKDVEIIAEMVLKHNLSIKYKNNEANLGYMKNMHQIFEKATGDILFLLADDDIISINCIELVKNAFNDPDIGVVGRPYYWFIDNFRNPVRFEGRLYEQIQKVSILSSPVSQVRDCISSAGQLSGLAFRRAFLSGMPFVEDMFTAHIYPFLYIFKEHACAYMPYATVAVSTSTSQCQNDIYTPSPMEQWINLYKKILVDKKCDGRRKELLECHILKNFMGLAQIKIYGTYKELFREIKNFAKYRKANLLYPKFYFFAIGSICCPRFILKKMINFYKQSIMSHRLQSLNIDFTLFPFTKCEPLWTFPVKNERN